MHPNEALVHRFYSSFKARDAEGMRACYHPGIVFSDPAFGKLTGEAAGDMWAMLCSRAHDLRLTFGNVVADEENGRADWEARYTFSQTGRPVHNRIHAAFLFRDGLIVRHIDEFSFWRWSRQALGPAGLLLGWTPVLRNKVQSAARAGLDAYRQKTAAAADATATPSS